MIIRSMSRKDHSFGQLIAYVNRDAADQDFSIHHNLLGRDSDEITAEFQDNAALLPKRRNANVMYHEIVSITRPKGLGERRQKEILREIAQSYIDKRAPHCLVYGALHDDHSDHLHFHLVISANRLGLSRRFYHSKKEFRAIATDLEKRVLAHYPELEQTVSINKVSDLKLSEKGRALKARTGKLSQKEAVANKLKLIFANAQTKADLFAAMDAAGLQFYIRGKSIGVKDLASERKHRLKKLELTQDFAVLSARIEADEARRKARQAQASGPSPQTMAIRDQIKAQVKQTVPVPTIQASQKQILPAPQPVAQDKAMKQINAESQTPAPQQKKAKAVASDAVSESAMTLDQKQAPDNIGDQMQSTIKKQAVPKH